ncbi:hypothetical protein AN639_00220 [Candidatus Epulonipiscium fishelsonii]|uniref:Uncharacterized protein n=1 Tax=Candidatus Epulonipiscium fishelsonii TaxID=77094 RepID=A0ACC8XEI5_9FIRM|nr:hypothetical protein AN396_00590 [Epulopiscium sp. SCG-B11WGA-EpuloA1]ONI43950.1 hypothetical protein AN639_00220 [Epulopiscium sp. SCG-B05WGA-EpuloA1]
MRYNFDYNCKKETDNLNLLTRYNYNTRNRVNNNCPPQAPWWDDGKYPDFEDFNNPWFNPQYGYNPNVPMPIYGYNPNVPMPIGIRPQEIDRNFIELYSGNKSYFNQSTPGYHYVPYWPYIAPDKPVEKENTCCCKAKCCCKKDEWECNDEGYYGRCE